MSTNIAHCNRLTLHLGDTGPDFRMGGRGPWPPPRTAPASAPLFPSPSSLSLFLGPSARPLIKLWPSDRCIAAVPGPGKAQLSKHLDA